jgi:serine/threonine protein kinase
MQIFAGSVVDHCYEVLGVLGKGGMASVWRVRHRQLQTLHALKVLDHASPDIEARLLAEGRIQARLSHPNLVRVTDLVVMDGTVGLVMDLVEGPDLRALLDMGRLPLDVALGLGGAVLEGVAYAHRAGLIHRDLKPGNILLEQRDGITVPRVTDFGLARALAPDAGARTRAGTAMGTPGYMAPEQYRDAATVDQRADVFSLGCVLYELLTGRPPFRGHDLATLFRAASSGDFAAPQSLDPSLPPEIVALLERALSPNPRDRFPDAGALAERWRAGAAQAPAGAAVAPDRVPTRRPVHAAETVDAFSIGDAAPDGPPERSLADFVLEEELGRGGPDRPPGRGARARRRWDQLPRAPAELRGL